MMNQKVHFKLYKNGKLWCCAAIASATLLFGMAGTQAAHAATSTSQATTAVSPAQNAHVVPVDRTTENNEATANQGHLDGYQLTTTQNGRMQLNANGWQVSGQSNHERYRYAILYDNTARAELGRQKVQPVDRPDVQKAYQHVDNSLHAGFNVHFQLPINVGGHSLSVVSRYSSDAINGEGQHTDFWMAPITIDNENRASLDRLVADQKGALHVSGWHATNQAQGKQYHYVIAFDQTTGREIARREVKTGQQRRDVAKAFPTIANAAMAGFDITFQLTPQYSRDQIQFISRWTNDPAGNGQAVDYWFAPVTKQNRGNLDQWSLSEGHLQVSGWHADDAAIYQPHHYLILVDNTSHRQVASAKVTTLASKDVAKAYGDTRSADRARFNYDFGQRALVAGHNYSLVSRYSLSDQGNGDDGNAADHTDYWFNLGTLNGQGSSIDSWHFSNSGRQVTISGWFANDQSLGHQYPYVIMMADGHEIGRQRVTLTDRPDVAKAYPHVNQSGRSGFTTQFTLPARVNNNLQVVFRFANTANGEGDHQDIWLGPLAANAGNFDRVQVGSDSMDIAGWHAAINTTGKPYQYLIALDAGNNQELGRWNITNQSGIVRHDVQRAFPWIEHSDRSGFKLYLNHLGNLDHRAIRLIHRYTDDQNGNGNAIDYWSGGIGVHNYNMDANPVNAYIANHHIGHAQIQFWDNRGIIPWIKGPFTGTPDGRPNMIVVHETANPNDSIMGEINYEHQDYRRAWVHAFVDNNNIIQIYSTDREAKGAGYPSNGRAIHFEQIEVHNPDAFAHELVNAAYYTAYNMHKYNLPVTIGPNGTVWTHHMVTQYLGGTTHVDPDGYWSRNAAMFGCNYTLGDFMELVKYEYYNM